MPAEMKGFHFVVNHALYASNVCDDAVVLNGIFYFIQIFYIKLNGCAEKKIVAGKETAVIFFAYSVNNTALQSGGESFSVFVIGKKTVIRMMFPDRFGNRAAY